MPAKRPVDDDDDNGGNASTSNHVPTKVSRHDLHNEYDEAAPSQSVSASARKKGTSNRTGQACDRCKLRKIRCDPQPGGCSPCAQNNTECRTTDRITGLARSRGHAENLEGENASLRAHVETLQKQLKDKGIDPLHPPVAHAGHASSSTEPHPSPAEQSVASSSWGSLQQPQVDAAQQQGTLLAEFRSGCIGDNYLGVASGNSWLSPIEGSTLSLFGATLDLAEFIPEDKSDSGTSYQNFLDKAFVEKQKNAPKLPRPEEGKMYAEWYFRSVQPLLPILHKSHFMQLLDRVYHENYQCNAAELVMVHMVMNMVMFQISTRNTQQPQRVYDFQHWHFALSLVPRLIKGHTLQDMQGLTLICAQLRAFPRPGACWMFTNTVLGLAIEMGLHRSVTAWQSLTPQQDPHSIELRKRIFWCLMLMHVLVSGKLGRPMPLRLEDIDIEIPEEAYDHLPEEAHLDEWRKCSFRSGVWGFVLLKVQIKVYSSIYSIGSTNFAYERNVKLLEKELKDTIAKFPPELSCGPETKEEDRVNALFLQLQAIGCQLLIHHPALCRSLVPQVMSDNIDACLDASNKMLAIATQLKVLNSLDTTIYLNMDFLASMFAMLFAYTERRERLNMNDLHRLRLAMKGWLDVMGSVGNLLGTGDRLHVALCNLVDWSLGNISRHLAQRTATAAVASTVTPPGTDHSQQPSQPHSQQPTPVNENGHSYGQSYPNGTPQGHNAVRSTHLVQVQPHQPPQQQTPQPTHQPLQPQALPHQPPHQHIHQQPLQTTQQQPTHQTHPQPPQPQAPAVYPSAEGYSYSEAQTTAVPSYTPAVVQAYNPQGYVGEDVKPNINTGTQLAAHTALPQQVSQPTAGNYMPMYQVPTAGYPLVDAVQPLAWRNFAENMATGMHTSAPAMTDGGLASYSGLMTEPIADTMPKTGPMVYANVAGASFGQMQMPSVDGSGSESAPQWPLIQY